MFLIYGLPRQVLPMGKVVYSGTAQQLVKTTKYKA